MEPTKAHPGDPLAPLRVCPAPFCFGLPTASASGSPPPPLGLLCTLSSVGKASVWALSHTWQTCHPIVTPALAHPSQALTPFSMRTKSSAHAYHQGLGTDKSQGPGSTRLAGVRQLVLIRQMIYLPHSITANSIYMIYLFRDGKAIHTWILRAYCSAWPQTGA